MCYYIRVKQSYYIKTERKNRHDKSIIRNKTK